MLRWSRWRACANDRRERKREREIQGGIFDFVARTTVLLHRLISQCGIAHGRYRVVRSHLVSYQRCPWESWRAKCLSWLIKGGEREAQRRAPHAQFHPQRTTPRAGKHLTSLLLTYLPWNFYFYSLNEAGRCAFAREIIGALYITIKKLHVLRRKTSWKLGSGIFKFILYYNFS